jgi:hypothetical protein
MLRSEARRLIFLPPNRDGAKDNQIKRRPAGSFVFLKNGGNEPP